MNSILRSFRSFIFTLTFVLIISGFYTLPVFTGTNEAAKIESTVNNICPDCYIVYVWIDHVRWAQVFDADGKMINCYEDPED